MSAHTPERAAAIVQAARAAGAIEPDDLLVLIPPAEMVNPADAVAKIKEAKPHFFKKSALEMSSAEAAAGMREIIRDGDRRRHRNDEAALLARLSRKYPKEK